MAIFDTIRRRKRRFYKSLILATAVSLLACLASFIGYFDALEAKALDLLFWLRGQQKSPEIVLVQIDDQAFRNLGEKQPLPRSYLAGLIDLVARGGAKVIALDIELKVPTNRREDETLLKAVQSAEENGVSKVVPVYIIRPVKEQDGTILYTRAPFFSSKLAVVAGFANAPVESDGFVRQLPLAVKGSDQSVLPSLALAVLARYAGYDASHLADAVSKENKITLLLPEWDRFQGRLLGQPTPLSFELDDGWKINFVGAQGSFVAIPSDPVFRLSKQKLPLAHNNLFRGKIVLIGATFADSRDFFPTPRGLMSGMEIHANVIHTLLSRSQILPMQRLAALLLSLAFAVMISFLLTLLRPSVVNYLSFAAVPVLLIPSYWAFARLGLWVDLITPFLAMRWGAMAGEYLENRHIRKSFGQYVDREVANQIIDEEESIGGEEREVSVFFTDIRNYTTLCEGLPPEMVVTILNELFTMMGEIITRHQGWIVDFVGDAVLAVFGAPKPNPNHAAEAVKTAIEIQQSLDEINARWEKRGIPPFRIGVGIHTGAVVAGVVGSGVRKKFGVTGDTVNTGSRVEGLNKDFSTSILITRATLDKLGGKIAVRNCGQVKVKGRETMVEVFEVLSPGAARDTTPEVP